MTHGTVNLIKELAEDFWKEAGLTPTYPLQPTLLEQAICLLLPVNIVRLNMLSVYKAAAWLAERSCTIQIEQDCPLYGLLFIHRGQGFIFLNGTLSPSEQCYTLAHELGHYLLEFEHPRKKTITLLGNGMEEIFQGTRKPTVEEELTGIIKRTNVSPYVHLLEENHSTVEERFQVWAAEDRADAMAFELLAPFHAVDAELNIRRESWSFNRIKEELPDILARKFGLPASVTKQYATAIAYRLFPHGGGLIEYLKQL